MRDLELLHRRAILKVFAGREGFAAVMGRVYAFCRPQLPEISATDTAFAARTDWGQILLWGFDKEGADAGPQIVSTRKLKGKVVFKAGRLEHKVKVETVPTLHSKLSDHADLQVFENPLGADPRDYHDGTCTRNGWCGAGHFHHPDRIGKHFGDRADSRLTLADLAAFGRVPDGAVLSKGKCYFLVLPGAAAELTEGVDALASTRGAFAALKAGRVLTWGDLQMGADQGQVAAELQDGVVSVVGNEEAFAAIKQTGQVVVWGSPRHGGALDPSGHYVGTEAAVAEALRAGGIVSVSAAGSAFAALTRTGRVVTWGRGMLLTSAEQDAALSSGVASIVGIREGFAALKTDGSVVSWGDFGGPFGDRIRPEDVAAELSHGVKAVVGTSLAFAAIKTTGGVVTWGRSSSGGDSSRVKAELSEGIAAVHSNAMAFAAIAATGRVVTWGDGDGGGDSGRVKTQLTDVVSIAHTVTAFAAIKASGQVVTWGAADEGGDSRKVAKELADVKTVVGNRGAFAAITGTGRVVTWGGKDDGGDSSKVAADLAEGVVAVVGTNCAFAAVKATGQVVTWGRPDCGGDSSRVAADLSQL